MKDILSWWIHIWWTSSKQIWLPACNLAWITALIWCIFSRPGLVYTTKGNLRKHCCENSRFISKYMYAQKLWDTLGGIRKVPRILGTLEPGHTIGRKGPLHSSFDGGPRLMSAQRSTHNQDALTKKYRKVSLTTCAEAFLANIAPYVTNTYRRAHMLKSSSSMFISAGELGIQWVCLTNPHQSILAW